MTINKEWVELPVQDGTSMRAYIAAPEGKLIGSLIVLQEAFGVNAHIRDVTERFAAEGYACIAPELYHRSAPGFEADYVSKAGVSEQMGALTDENLIADVHAAMVWLTKNAPTESGKIGAIGYCMGGRTAFLANTALPLSCAVSYYGARIASTLLDRVESASGPTLLLWGGLDDHISSADHKAITDALDSAGKEYANIVFSYGEHGFFCDARASYNQQAATEAWGLTLAFLKNKLT